MKTFMKKESINKLIIVAVFAIAMAFIETMIVVYLRKLYYPAGFSFPLVSTIETSILNMEWFREFCTVVMLIAIGLLAGKTIYEKLAYFLYSFAIWDIFYYIWLKVTLNWPSSLMDWDLLFLIPWPWAGPVIAPVINSITMITLAILIIHFQDKNKKPKLNRTEWSLLIAGSLIFLYTYLVDYGQFILQPRFLSQFLALATNPELQQIISNYSPTTYNWILFALGQVLQIIAIFSLYKRTTQKR